MNAPEPGTYGCVKTSGFYPWLIRKGTRSEYNHAFIVGFNGEIFEAEPGGARMRRLEEYEGCEMVFSKDVLTTRQRSQIVVRAETLLGTPYGWTDIARLALSSRGVAWDWLTHAADAERAMICSQLVAVCGESADVDWNCGQESPAAVTPGMLAARAMAQ